jgi:small subunit ribosomal protein S1
MKQKEQNQEIPPLDEGWWASVLSDEEAVKGAKDQPVKTLEPVKDEGIDWDRIRSLFERDEVVDLRVHGYNRGGLLVQGNGFQGFVPISHLVNISPGLVEDERKKILAGLVGQILSLKVIECDPDQDRVVFSQRAALAGQGRRTYLFNSLKPGVMVEGVVTNVTDFGVFVDLGGLEGLIHVSELSWGRVQHPNDIVSLGQNLRTVVLQIFEENGRVALSLKRLDANPWDEIAGKLKPGDVIPAVITKLAKFGAFARLDEGVEGLIHISTFKLRPGDKLADFLATGDKVQVRILHIEPDKRRLGLCLA